MTATPPPRSGPPSGASSRARSPLAGTTRLLVDGTNLLYRIGRVRAAPPAAVIGRLRAAVPATVTIDLVFDGVGHGVFGRVAQKMTVRYSGKRTADDVILDLTSEAAMEAPGGSGKAGAEAVLAVTNDRELRERLHAKGARTVPLQWLISRMDLPVLVAPSVGNRRPPSIGTGRAPGTPGHDGDDRPGWKPGRGATTKTGPARKVARHKRHPRHPA
jgi:hypothetical protein